MYLKRHALLQDCIEQFLIEQMQDDITYLIPLIHKSLISEIAEWEFADLGSVVEIYRNEELEPALLLRRQ